MASDLLSTWLLHYDPIHRGWTPAGIANGVCATCGFAFPRIRGGYNLRRNCGAGFVLVGAAGADARQVSTFPWVTHEADAAYEYRLAAVNGGGCENLSEAPTVEVQFGPEGERLMPRPNAPWDLRVAPMAGGRFELRWTYAPEGQAAEPLEFRVYSDGGTGTIDYDAPVASVPYRPGRFHYVYTSAALPDGVKVRWAVRAASGARSEEANERSVAARADALGPADAPVVALTRVSN